MILSIFLSLIITSFVTSLLIIVFALFSRSFPRLMSSRTRYTIWVFILLSLLIPIKPLLGNGFFTLTLPHITKPTVAVNEVTTSASKLSETNSTFSLPSFQFLFYLLLLIWVLGSLISLIRHLIQYLKFRHLIQRAGQEVTDKETLELFEDLSDCMQIKNKQITLIRCNFIKSPMLTGIRRPVILLPEQEFSEQQLEIILEHELTHYIHRDLFINLLMIIVTSLHWFNPIIRFANRVIQEEGEILCDESVLRGKNLNYRRFYGKTILSLIENGGPKSIALSTHFFESKMNLQHRLIAILDIHNPMKRLSYSTLILSILTIFLFNSVFVFATTVDNNHVSQRTPQKQESSSQNQTSSNKSNSQNQKATPATSNASASTSSASADKQASSSPTTSEANSSPATTVQTPATGTEANSASNSAPSYRASDEEESDSDGEDSVNEVGEADD